MLGFIEAFRLRHGLGVFIENYNLQITDETLFEFWIDRKHYSISTLGKLKTPYDSKAKKILAINNFQAIILRYLKELL